MSIKEGLHKKAGIIEAQLNTYFDTHDNSYQKELHDSMLYSLLNGGKRIRPVLLIEIGELFGAKKEDLIDFACAIEMIHTYSLIHDDLPAMDDDDLRRGKKTNHIVYGEAMAILAGDGLLNFAYELMTEVSLKKNSYNYLKAMKEISKAAGHQGMVGGQVADCLSEGKVGTKETLEYIQLNKTSALLTCALTAGGCIAGVSEMTLNDLRKLGTAVGLAFQIKDDILDIESNESVLGKPIGSDEKNRKLTYPSVFGLEASKAKVRELTDEANRILINFDGDTTFLESLVNYLCNREY
ncbi:MAG: polyprenyl synthetase family protein [Clostridiales bacterium]|nr:polyprenyl synthetase family protein [Clostridiales bacterium]